MEKLRSIRDPIHGFVELTESEWAIVNSRPVQRLRDIRQLGMGHMVYPGANHTRFEHSLGVVDVSTRMFDHVRQSTEAVRWGEAFGGDRTGEKLRQVLRIASLTHDLGHAPFSHSGEHLFVPGDQYQAATPEERAKLRTQFNHEEMTVRILRETEVRELVEACGVSVEEVVYVATSESASDVKDFRPDLDLLNQLLTGELGSDRCDYLLRDAYHSGQPGGQFDLDRVVQQMAIIEHNGALYLGLRQGGQIAAEQMIANRYVAYANLYFHKAKRAYERHLVRFLESWLPSSCLPQSVAAFLDLSDSTVQAAVVAAAAEPGVPGHADAIALRDRRHFRVVSQFFPADRRFGAGTAGRAISSEAIEKFAESVRDTFGEAAFVDILSHSATRIRRNRIADKILILREPGARYLDELSEIVSGMDEKIWRLRVHASADAESRVRQFCGREWEQMRLGAGGHS